jgi:hypothetical protein
MDFEDLGRVWQEQETGDFQRRKVESLSTVRGRAERLLNGLHRRGRRIAAVTVIGCAFAFTAGILNSPRPWLAGTGVLLLAIWLAHVIRVVLELAGPKGADPLPVRASVEFEIRRLRILERFWGKAHWIFLAFLVGEVMAFEGFRPPDVERGVLSGGFYVFLVAIVVYGTLARRRDARAKVRPLREELESWLADLEAFEFDREMDARRQEGEARP